MSVSVLQAPRRHKGYRTHVTMPMVARMQQLLDAGLSARATAIVIGVDFGQEPHPKTVRLYTRTYGKNGQAGVSRRPSS